MPVRVTLDGGADPAIRTAAPAVQQAVQEITQDVFTCESVSLADDGQLILDRTPLGDPRAAPAPNGVTFRGTIIEWSLDALRWLAAFLGDLSVRPGMGLAGYLEAWWPWVMVISVWMLWPTNAKSGTGRERRTVR